ncbi:hypothetical protein Srufu_045630 [Streptomyces libani subsp. rufus]|nr:hypothetical protein Srufu_045630 [Streptomyces libani subsp. rufus]
MFAAGRGEADLVAVGGSRGDQRQNSGQCDTHQHGIVPGDAPEPRVGFRADSDAAGRGGDSPVLPEPVTRNTGGRRVGVDPRTPEIRLIRMSV